MPGPQPGTVWIESRDCCVEAYIKPYWPRKAFEFSPPSRNRVARAQHISERYAAGDWVCRWCKCVMHFDKRADAVYCREACRKAASRARQGKR